MFPVGWTTLPPHRYDTGLVQAVGYGAILFAYIRTAAAAGIAERMSQTKDTKRGRRRTEW